VRYALVEVGCLECHEPTVFVGVFPTLEAAAAAAQDAAPPVLTPRRYEDVRDEEGVGAGRQGVSVILDLEAA